MTDELVKKLHPTSEESSPVTSEESSPNNKLLDNILFNNKIIEYSFDDFWNLYDKKSGSKTQSEKLFLKLKKSDISKIKEHLPKYIESTPEKKYRKNPETYLRQKHFENEVEPLKYNSQNQWEPHEHYEPQEFD